MSYILDALRRADAERERSEAPGLHAQHLDAPLGDDTTPDEPRRRHRGWLAIGGAAGLAALLAWFFLAREVAAPPPAPLAAQTSAPLPAAPPAPVPAPVPPAAVAAPPPARVTSLPPMPAPPPPPVAVPARTAPPVAAVAPSAPSASAPEPRVPTWAELPDDLRREIPTLVIGGAMYSPTPANRMIVLNGLLMHEGDQPAPGLVLEQINLKTAVLRYKGQRFRIVY